MNVTLFIEKNTFASNHALQKGGAVYGLYIFNIKINRTDFFWNWASTQYGGAIYVEQRAKLLLRNCEFEDNFVEGSDGAVSAYYHTVFEIIDTNFTRNKASINGGALSASMSEIHIKRCLFIGNSANLFGGSLYIASKSVLIELTTFKNNSGTEGGAVFVKHSELKTKQCTFRENLATHKAGAVRVDFDSSILKIAILFQIKLWMVGLCVSLIQFTVLSRAQVF